MACAAACLSVAAAWGVPSGFAAAERCALASLPPGVGASCFAHLDRTSLDTIHAHLAAPEEDAAARQRRDGVIGAALLRRIVCIHLDKRAARGPTDASTVDRVLSLHTLPAPVAAAAAAAAASAAASAAAPVPDAPPPRTWLDLLTQLHAASPSDLPRLWSLVEAAPWLSYVPVQCVVCGKPVPDVTAPAEPDAAVGLREVEPTAAERPFLRAGYFRGPRGPVAFELSCPGCGVTSRWFRSSHPSVTLNPNRWGRLCGEQEDLRAWLAEALGVGLRTVVPLDWDHVWSEKAFPPTEGAGFPPSGEEGELPPTGAEMTFLPLSAESAAPHWLSPTGTNARNFAARLDEGIGAWTRVLAVSCDPHSCGCVTEAYLRSAGDGGLVDAAHAARLREYRRMVLEARADSTGRSCQAGTLNGYVLASAGFSDDQVTAVMARAAAQHAAAPSGEPFSWWQIAEADVPTG
jgi:hypothetical protein